MFTNILVATDGSEPAKKAVRMAARLAKQCGDRLLIVTVLPSQLLGLEALESGWTPDPQQDFAQLRHAYQSILDAGKGLAEQEGVAAEGILREGSPAQTIVEVAEERKAGLLVLGRHGRSLAGSLLLGSVSDRVNRLSKVSVLLVH